MHPGIGVSSGGNTVGSTGTVFGTYVLQGGNNVTLSQITSSLGTHTVVISVPAGATATGNFGGLSAGTQLATTGTVIFADSNGISWGMSGSSQITATVRTDYLTTARASTDAIGLNTAQTNVTWTVNSSGLSLNAAGYAGINGAITGGSITVNTSGVSVNLPAYLTTADLSQNSSKYVQNWKLTGNTAGTTSSAQGSDLWFSGGNSITVSGNSNTVVFSVGNYITTAMQSNAATISNIRVSGGTTSNLLSALTFADSNGVSWGLNASTLTATVKTAYAGTVSGATNCSVTVNTSGVSVNVPLLVEEIVCVFDGGSSVPAANTQAWVEVPFACTINRATMLADASGSAVIDVWKDTYANYPPTVADTITASAKPTLSTAISSQDSTLTGWTTSISAGDILKFNLDSCTTIKKLVLVLKVTRT